MNTFTDRHPAVLLLILAVGAVATLYGVDGIADVITAATSTDHVMDVAGRRGP